MGSICSQVHLMEKSESHFNPAFLDTEIKGDYGL